MKLSCTVIQVQGDVFLIWMGPLVILFLLRNRLKLTKTLNLLLLITEMFSLQELQERIMYHLIYSSSSVWQQLLAVLVKLVGARCF